MRVEYGDDFWQAGLRARCVESRDFSLRIITWFGTKKDWMLSVSL